MTNSVSHGSTTATAAASLFKTLGHPVRVLLLEVLCSGPATVAQLREAAEVSPSNLSQHLRSLRDGDLITASRSEGTLTYRPASTQTAALLATAHTMATTTATAATMALQSPP